MDEHWQIVAAGGKQISNTPEGLWESAKDYFDWCDTHPIKSKRTLTSGKEAGAKVTLEFVRPYTIKGFCLHAGISEKYISDIKESHRPDSEYVMIMERILYIIYNQNLEGAYVDLYNPIIVSKVLNLDKVADTTDKPPRVEIIDTGKDKLANSEDEVLQKLDYGKVDFVKDKSEISEREKDIRAQHSKEIENGEQEKENLDDE